jgi:hypothetical protein
VTLHANDDREKDGTTRGSIIAGSARTETHSIYYDATMSFVPKTGTRTGYTYGGVTLNKVAIKNRKKEPSVATVTTLYKYDSNKDLYVNWINNEYKLTLDLDGGKVGNLAAGDTLTVYFDAVYPFKWSKGASSIYDKVIDAPVKTDNEFHFFVDEANKNAATWSDLLTKEAHDNLYASYAVEKDTYTLTSNQTVAAWYSPTTFKATLNADGGSFDDEKEVVLNIPYTYKGGYASSSYVIPEPTFEGHKLTGWYKDGSSRIIRTKDLYNSDWFIYKAGEKAHTLKAAYEEIVYNVKYAMSYLPKGCSGVLPEPIETVKYNATVSIVEGVFNLTNGRRFTGWSVANGLKKGTMISQESLPYETTRLSNVDGETITLEARFSPEKKDDRGGGSSSGGGDSSSRLGNASGKWYYDLIGWIYLTTDKSTLIPGKASNGLYKIRYKDNEYRYYGFDEKGYMVSGFYNFYGHTYYFNENPRSPEYGAMVFDTVTLNGTQFVMDKEIGELVEVVTNVSSENTYTSKWEVSWFNDPTSNSTLLVAIDGNKVVALEGAVGLNGIWYVFNEYGIMQRGIIKYRGYYYYLIPEGLFEGAVYPIEIEIDGVKLDFKDVKTGRLQNPDSIRNVTSIKPIEINGQIGIENAKWG